jgi:hypothetical protein
MWEADTIGIKTQLYWSVYRRFTLHIQMVTGLFSAIQALFRVGIWFVLQGPCLFVFDFADSEPIGHWPRVAALFQATIYVYHYS